MLFMHLSIEIFTSIFAATIHSLLLSTMLRITYLRALQLILQLCALLTPAIKATCYILLWQIHSVAYSYIYQNSSYSFLSGWHLLISNYGRCLILIITNYL